MVPPVNNCICYYNHVNLEKDMKFIQQLSDKIYNHIIIVYFPSNTNIRQLKIMKQHIPACQVLDFFEMNLRYTVTHSDLYSLFYHNFNVTCICDTIIYIENELSVFTHQQSIYYIYGIWDKDPMPDHLLANIKKNDSINDISIGYIMNSDDIDCLLKKHNDVELYNMYHSLHRKVCKADIARYLTMLYRTGYYFDTDIIQKKNMYNDFLVENDDTTDLILFAEHDDYPSQWLGPREDKKNTTRIYNCIFWSKINDNTRQFWMKCIDLCKRRIYTLHKKENNYTNWTDFDVLWATGPDVITTIWSTYFSKSSYVKLIPKHINAKYFEHSCLGSWRCNNDT